VLHILYDAASVPRIPQMSDFFDDFSRNLPVVALTLIQIPPQRPGV